MPKGNKTYDVLQEFEDAEVEIARILQQLERIFKRSISGVDVVRSNKSPRKVEAVQIRIETHSELMSGYVNEIVKED